MHQSISLRANKLGYLVRIAPEEVACSDPEAIKVKPFMTASNLLSDTSRLSTAPRLFSKRYFLVACVHKPSSLHQTDCYDAWAPPNNGYVGHFSARDDKEHSERRRIVNNVYSLSSVLESENAIDSCTQLFCESMRDFARQESIVDLGLWINM